MCKREKAAVCSIMGVMTTASNTVELIWKLHLCSSGNGKKKKKKHLTNVPVTPNNPQVGTPVPFKTIGSCGWFRKSEQWWQNLSSRNISTPLQIRPATQKESSCVVWVNLPFKMPWHWRKSLEWVSRETFTVRLCSKCCGRVSFPDWIFTSVY